MYDDASYPPTDAPPEPAHARNERIFQSLPPLNSPEYLSLLKTASASDLPAEVLVRAYQELGYFGRAAEATLERLLTKNQVYGYLRPLLRMAQRRVMDRDWFSASDLFDESISVIALALAGPQGKGAHRAWLSFLQQRLEDAYRSLNGRRNERQDPERCDPHVDPETGEEIDPMESAAVLEAPWHGRVDRDRVGWLEQFMKRSMARIRHREIREVGLDQLSAERSAISGPGKPGKPSLAMKYNVDRFQIMRWRDAAFARLVVDLEQQDEEDIDVSWLRDALDAKQRKKRGR